MTDAAIPGAIAATLVDPTAYADDRIHEAYRWLRENHPLGIAQPPGFDPFWVVTRHSDILEISRQNAAFHNGDRATTLVDRATDAATRAMTGGSPHLVRSLVQMDEPDHRKYRATVDGVVLATQRSRARARDPGDGAYGGRLHGSGGRRMRLPLDRHARLPTPRHHAHFGHPQ